jgi:ADP-ribose pyrophosphatase YjhB (NUDIX family)
MIWLQQLIGGLLYLLGWPVIGLYLRGSQRSRLIVRSEGHILLVKGMLGNGGWSLPGGGLRAGEQPRAGAARELLEETGINLKPASFKMLGKLKVTTHGHRFTAVALSAELKRRTPLRRRRLELTAAAWIPVKKLSKIRLEKDSQQIVETWSKPLELVQ